MGSRGTVAACVAVGLVLGLAGQGATVTCPTPPLASNYTGARYAGRWYEIGKIQTFGGAIFERNCVCTTNDVSVNSSTQLTAVNGCREKTVTGKLTDVTQRLEEQAEPGRYLAYTFRFEPPVAYNVIHLDADSSVEFDCGVNFGIINYCFHILSRNATMSAAKVQQLLQLAAKYDLNIHNLDYKATLQAGCWP